MNWPEYITYKCADGRAFGKLSECEGERALYKVKANEAKGQIFLNGRDRKIIEEITIQEYEAWLILNQ